MESYEPTWPALQHEEEAGPDAATFGDVLFARDESLSLVRNDSNDKLALRLARCHFGIAQLHSKWLLWSIQFSVPHRGAGTFACVLLMHTPGGQMCRTGRDIAVHADGSSFVCLSEGLM